MCDNDGMSAKPTFPADKRVKKPKIVWQTWCLALWHKRGGNACVGLVNAQRGEPPVKRRRHESEKKIRQEIIRVTPVIEVFILVRVYYYIPNKVNIHHCMLVNLIYCINAGCYIRISTRWIWWEIIRKYFSSC